MVPKFIWIILYTLWVSGVCGAFKQDITMLNKAKRSFVHHKIIPEVVTSAPTYMLKTNYNGHPVKFGNLLTPIIVKERPQVNWFGSHNEFLFMLCMVDPDYPYRYNATKGQWLHWLVVNIPGKNIDQGKTLAEYVGAKPLPSIDAHRQVLLVYKQRKKFKFDEPYIKNNTAENRVNFVVNKFAAKYKMGDPVAGNFFLVKYDGFVPILHQQLGLSFEKESKIS